MKYAEEAGRIWRTYVPKRGQADTVQGELIRAVEKLRDEAVRNGNINWDDSFERLVLFLQRTLSDSQVFDTSASQEIADDLTLISDPGVPADDGPFDRLTDCLVVWCREHPDPVARSHDPDLRR
ncbi:hypothetical protein C8250_041410 [Streptomyces sp. So13.3]|uniref:hypothetical protein n=1 Tax=unclassified Streptomyces TaxID=2593676 RepID=UPI001106B2F2|nr:MULTISPECIES: hypothetical protein [unclassified Streptomyces]NEA72582.1 hypothetical protein [Streptomyces sp. SID13588]QNA73113.1 hypothetical protein C8250_015375 [Streptomyces sp. So13.3]QNA77411.1 hypothetical protein C8250_041410 [Streptomyces sp. So13.3]